jgi:Ca2+-binding EF-hand superfamily protein
VVDLRRMTPTSRRFFVKQSLPRFLPSYNAMPSVQQSLPCLMRLVGAKLSQDPSRKSGPPLTRVRATPLWSPAMDSIDDETQEMLDRYLGTFQSADSNGDGMLQRDELRDLLERAGGGAELVPLHWLDEKDIDLIFKAYDINGDGMISFEEFVPLAHDNCWLTKELDAYRSAFAAIDTGGNGTISPTELCEIFTRLGSPFRSYEKICAIMEKYDLDHNGEFDFKNPLCPWCHRDQRVFASHTVL